MTYILIVDTFLQLASVSLVECGVPLVQANTIMTKIVYGQSVRPHSWPWQVALIDTTDETQFCGGDRYVLFTYIISAIRLEQRFLLYCWRAGMSIPATFLSIFQAPSFMLFGF